MPCCGVGPGSSSGSGGDLQHCSAVGGPPWSGGQPCDPGISACTCRAGQHLCVDSHWLICPAAGWAQRCFAHSLLDVCFFRSQSSSMQTHESAMIYSETLPYPLDHSSSVRSSDCPLQSVHAAVTACRPSGPLLACPPQVQASSTPCMPAVAGSTWCRPCFSSRPKEKALRRRCACLRCWWQAVQLTGGEAAQRVT